MAFKDHFSTQSSDYAAYRPSYPQALADFLADSAPKTEAALDCGCGTGQLSVLLARRFAKVVAVDASAAQIANAKPHPKVDYRVAPAENVGLPNTSVDLVVAAQAAHWFDLEAFYAEVRRVARPGAILALVAYAHLQLDDDACAQAYLRFYGGEIDSYWPPERRIVEAGYRDLPFPFTEIEAPPLAIEVAWSMRELVGYVSTWSAVQAAAKALGRDPTERLRHDLAQIWGEPETRRNIRWPLALRVGRL